MQKSNPWRPIIIIGAIVLCAYGIYHKGLKRGIDLAGGFVLTYEVNVQKGQDTSIAVEQIINVLSKRVDPTGVRNLVWRRQGATRLEIQAALAAPEVRKLREAYTAAFDALKASNVTRFQIESALRKGPAERQAEFDVIAGNDPTRVDRLKKLAAAYDAQESSRKPYEQAVKEAALAKEDLDKLPPDAAAEKKAPLEAILKERQADLTAKTKAYFEARRGYEPALNAVIAMNLDTLDLERALNLPNIEETDKEGKKVNPRVDAIKRLSDQHPDRAKQVQAVADAWAAYAVRRGPLDDPEDLIALLRGNGVLEFRVAPEPGPSFDTYREQLRAKGPNIGGEKQYIWLELDDVGTFAETARQKEDVKADPAGFFASHGLVGERYGDKFYLLLSNREGERLSTLETGWRLDSASQDRDNEGFPAIAFQLNTVGGQLLGEMTEKNKNRLMTIVLDGRAINAATIRSRIDSRGQISRRGGYGKKELDYMIRTLNAGSLKASLSERPSSIKFFQAEAGEDNLRRGFRAFVISAIAVAGFMIVYYFVWGGVAVLALTGNIVIILGVMAWLESAFTMSGIAGVVLTIGMAVDANVLIFERIREELSRGADVKTAVRLGFDKALSTIIDSNATTLITCLILGYFATADVRGFAVTLGIGLVANVFTAVYCSRAIIDFWVRFRNPSRAPMLPLSFPAIQKVLTPNIDWMAKRKVFFTISAVTSVIGLAVFFARGADMLDIEFRSGTQVGFKLAPGKQVALPDARKRLAEVSKSHNMPALDPARASVVAVGDLTANLEAKEFTVSVLDEDSLKVSDAIKDAFKDVLATERAIRFKGDGVEGAPVKPAGDAEPAEPAVPVAPVLPDFVYVIRNETLGASIGHESDLKVNEFQGGIAIVLDELSPPASIASLTKRIKYQRAQPKFESLGDRDCQVVGLKQAPIVAGQTEPLYTAVAVIVTDRVTNYVESPTAFNADVTGLAGSEWNLVREALLRDSSLDSVSNFSAQVSATMQRQAIVALLLSMLAITIYIWFRFGTLRFGAGAILALIHDVCIAIGFVAMAGLVYDTPIGPLLGLSDFKINLTMIAAILTIVGYSINDTIVVFDRIRENRGRLATVSPQMINDSVNQTISRTFLTGGTTLLALIVLYLLGGEAVRGFAFALFIGVLTGTYSSMAIASPLLLIKGLAPAPEAATKDLVKPV
jgi:SecD/SecF fusion protein